MEAPTIAQISSDSIKKFNEKGFPTLDFWLSVIPEEYRNVQLPECEDLPPKLVTFGEAWAKTLPFKSLFLYGQYGSGKTTLAFGLIRELFRRINGKAYFWPNYYTGRQLDSCLLKASKQEETDEYELEKFKEMDLLFIDDLDKISATERFKLQFFEIMNGRQTTNKPTIITSNCLPSELASLLDGAVISRMGDQKKWNLIKFPDKDLRRI